MDEPFARTPIGRSQEGIALACGNDGTIRRMIWNDRGVSVSRCESAPFHLLVRASEVPLASHLVERLRPGSLSSGEALHVAVSASDRSETFAAGRLETGHLLVVASAGPARVFRLLEGLLRDEGGRGGAVRSMLSDVRRHLADARARNRHLAEEVASLRHRLASFGDGPPEAAPATGTAPAANPGPPGAQAGQARKPDDGRTPRGEAR